MPIELKEGYKTNDAKVYVDVYVHFHTDGSIEPKIILWEDGTHYQIDRVLDIRTAAAAKAGGQGDRYTVQINGRPCYLFFEHSAISYDTKPGKWFVQRRHHGQ